MALLDEIVAGCEKNTKAIEYGTAAYSVSSKRFTPEGVAKDSTYQYRITYDYPLLRSDDARERTIFLPDKVITMPFSPGVPGIKYDPVDHSAFIHRREANQSAWIHPRAQHGTGFATVADHIQLSRKATESGIELSAEKLENGDIGMTFRHEKSHFLGQYVVAPGQGYSLVRAVEFSLKLSADEPMESMTASYREVDGGAFILKQREETHWIWDAKVRTKRAEIHLELTSFDATRPDPSLFGIQTIGLPVGGRIQDWINNKTSIFGEPDNGGR